MECFKWPDRWWKNWQWGTALLAGPVLWITLYWVDSPVITLSWIIERTWLFLSIVLFYPVLEEIVFRGLVQGWLAEKPWGMFRKCGISGANFLTSMMFAMFHVIAHAPLMAALVVFPSLIFGYFRDRYDGWLLPSIFLHCYYNLGYFILYKPLI